MAIFANYNCGMSIDSHYEDILQKQLAMNRQTWAALQKHGVTEEAGKERGCDFDGWGTSV